MTGTQKAALRVLSRFVTDHGGNPDDIRQIGNAYRWTAPDGRVAQVGWK